MIITTNLCQEKGNRMLTIIPLKAVTFINNFLCHIEAWKISEDGNWALLLHAFRIKPFYVGCFSQKHHIFLIITRELKILTLTILYFQIIFFSGEFGGIYYPNSTSLSLYYWQEYLIFAFCSFYYHKNNSKAFKIFYFNNFNIFRNF